MRHSNSMSSRLLLRPVLVLLWSRHTSGQACVDDSPECAQWAANGECTNNPAYMLASCRKSCRQCVSGRSQREAGGQQQQQQQQHRSQQSQQSQRTAKTAKSEDVLGAGAYSLHVGKLKMASKAILHTGNFDLVGAREWCDARSDCKGFSVHAVKPTPLPQGMVRCTFLKGVSSLDENLEWVSFVKGGLPGQCEGSACSGNGWHEKQVAAYYLRTAERYAEQKNAQGVIDQVRYALLSGADREVAYMLRAPVYLQLENIDNCKRDLSAVRRGARSKKGVGQTGEGGGREGRVRRMGEG